MPLPQDDVEFVHLRRLAASLENMRRTDVMTDVTLLCGKQKFQAHRLILAAASPYFESMFRSDWRDARSEEYDLPCWSADITASILSFIYTGQLKETSITQNKEAMKMLLEAADYFQIDDLVEYCFKTIADLSLSVTNFWEMYVLADKFSNEHQMACIENLLSPNLIETCESEDFLHLDKCHLQKIFQHQYVDHCCMPEVVEALMKWTEFKCGRDLDLKELMDILNLYWCPMLLNDLILENISSDSWSPATTSLLDEISTSQHFSLICHMLTNDNQKFICFRDDLVHLYDMEKDEWLPSKRLPFDVDHRAVTVVYRRHIFFFGGETATQFANCEPTTVIQYCPFTNAVVDQPSGELLFAVNYAGAGVLGDNIYIINGQDNNPETFQMVQCYDPNVSTCYQVASTLKHHYRPLVFSFRDKLYAFGSSPYNEKSLECFDPFVNQWTELTIIADIPEVTGCYHAAFSETKLFCLSQSNSNYQFYTFDLVSQEIEIADFDAGPDGIEALWSVTQNRKPFLVAVDHHNAPHFYDVEAQLWVTTGPKNDYVLCHHLSLCM